MRQRRYQDAAGRYLELRHESPSDLWTNLGYASALELAGKVSEAQQVLEETAVRHRANASLHRFRHLFFVRREDLRAAADSQKALKAEIIDDGPDDQLADLYFNQGRYHEAMAELERLLAADRLEGELKASVMARLGACLRQSGEPARARERLVEALVIDPDNHWALSELAEAERALGNIDAARTRYREALDRNDDDHWTRGHLAQLEAEQGDVDTAVTLYEAIIAAEPKAAWAKVELAQVVGERDPERSAALCHEVLESDPANPWANAHLGTLARRAGRLDEARAHFQQASAGSPHAVWVFHELADVCRHLERFEEAYAHLDHARSLEPYNAVTYGYTADVLRGQDRGPEAMANLEKAVDLDSAYTWAWRELAELRALAGRHDDADTAYRAATDLEPDAAVNDGLKAFLLRHRGRRDAAAPWLERALERQPDYLWAWRELIDWHLSANRASDAEACARKALVALPDQPALLGLLSESLRRQGKRTAAVATLSRALQLADEAAQLWALRAELAAEDDDLVEALACARKAAERDDAPEYQALLAQVLVASGRTDEARDVIAPLLKAAAPLQPASELAAVLAERRGDLNEAILCCDRGLITHPNDPRLLLRRARLALQRESADGLAATQALDVLFEALPLPGRPVPWREVAQVYAQAKRASLARRAALLAITRADARDADDSARAWLALAEVELALGDQAHATAALETCLGLAPDLAQARILGTVMAEGQGDLALAITHLDHLDRVLTQAADPTPSAAVPDEKTAEQPSVSGTDPGLLRQLALLLERHGEHERAAAVWTRMLNDPRTGIGLRADHAAWLVRRGQHEAAETLFAALYFPAAGADEIAGAPEAANSDASAIHPIEAQRLLRELAVDRARRLGPASALAWLSAREERLNLSNRVLLAEFAMTVGDHARATALLATVAADEPSHRGVGLLHARALQLGGDRSAAEAVARTWWTRAIDEDAAVVIAECCAFGGAFADALAILTHHDLPERLSSERALLHAMIALEYQGVDRALAVLGRVAEPDRGVAMVRVFAEAWPGLWPTLATTSLGGTGVEVRAVLADLATLPPFPHAARRLARALGARRRHDLAAHLLLAVAEVSARHGEAARARQLLRLAVPHLRRIGQRHAAFATAWQARALGVWLRCCLP